MLLKYLTLIFLTVNNNNNMPHQLPGLNLGKYSISTRATEHTGALLRTFRPELI